MFVSGNSSQHSYFARSQLENIEESMERLTSGKRINSAADNAASSAQVSSANTQILEAATNIAALGTTSDLLSTAELSMQSLSTNLQAMRSLLVARANDTLTATDRASIDTAIDGLQRAYEQTLGVATFNGQNLLNEGFTISTDSLNMELEIRALGLSEITSATSSPSGTVVSVNGVEQTQYEVQEIAIPKNLNQVDNSGVDFTDLASDIEDADIVSLQNGEFVAVFSRTSSGYGLYGQKFNQAGVAIGTEFQISDETGFGDGKNATAEALAGGGFAVGYSENSQAKVRIFSATGTVTTTINIPSVNGDSDLSLSSNQSDQLFVTWTEQSGSNQLLRGAVYESDGSVIRDAFTITSNSNPNSVEDRFGYYHSARISDDKFVVSWIQRFNISPRVHSIFAKVIGVESENDTAVINIPSPRGSSDFSSLKVLGLEDDTALIAFGDEGPGNDAGDVLTRKIDSTGTLLDAGKLGPVARQQISIIQTPDNQLVYYENGFRQEIKVYRDTETIQDNNYLDNARFSRTSYASELADVIATNADGVVMLMGNGLSIQRFSIDDRLVEGTYTLSAAGTTLTGTLTNGGGLTLEKLIEAFEADAHYDANVFTLAEINGNLNIQFHEAGDQPEASLQGPSGSVGQVAELISGTPSTFVIDLNALSLDDSSYSLTIDDFVLDVQASPGTPKTPETLLAALKASDGYQASGISLALDGEQLVVTAEEDDQPNEVILSKAALDSESVSMTLESVDEALESISGEIARVGAMQNRISYSSEVLTRKLTATTSFRSRIEDADFALEVSRLAQSQILKDINIKMQVQDNVSKQLVLSLLR